MRLRSNRLLSAFVGMTLLVAHGAAADEDALTAAQRVQLEVLAHADSEGLEPADYRVETLQALAQSADSNSLQRFSGMLSRAFADYGRDLSRGRLDPATDPQWRMTASAAEAFTPPQELNSVNAVELYLRTITPASPQYIRLRAVLNRYLDIDAQGGWPRVADGEPVQAGSRDERVAVLRDRLRISGHYRAQMQADPWFFDKGLDEAVRRFQAEQGIRSDGIVDERTLKALNIGVETRIRQLKLVMERWRWLPADPGERYLRVNIPGADLELIENGRLVTSMRVIVGRSYRQTPSLSGVVSQITINPTWTVPHKLAVEDLLPQQRNSPSFLTGKHIRVFSRKDGREVDPRDIDWRAVTQRTFDYQLRQDAGPENSLGRLKFSFDNPYDIYLHDSPSKLLFRLPGRAFSAGCVRLEDPLALAHYLLDLNGLMSPGELKRAIASGETRTVDLATGVPIYLVYLTAWVDDEGGVNFRDDVYSRDAIVGRAWDAESGRRTAAGR